VTALLTEKFACPRCGGSNAHAESGELRCESCDGAFPIVGDIPRFVGTAAGDSAQVQRVFDFEHRRYRNSWYTQFHPRLVG